MPSSPEAAIDLADLLAFYAEAGVDEAMGDAPVDRFAETAAVKAQRDEARARPGTAPTANKPAAGGARKRTSLFGVTPAAPAAARAQTAAVPDGAQAAIARDLARSAQSLDALRQIMADYDGCNLKATAKSLVFADGNPDAGIMFVGNVPERDEDIEGVPFVGRSGQFLDRMLAAIGLDRTSSYMANVIPWRPPGNRKPTPQEIEICRPFIERHIELFEPKIVVALGEPAAKFLLRTDDNILRLRGTWREHTTPSGLAIPTMPTLHPAYLLRNPAHKKLAWKDFLEIKLRLGGLG